MSNVANKAGKGAVPNAGLSDKDIMGLLDKLIAEGAQELSLERLLWKAELCGQFPVIGYIISINDMPQADRADNPDWKAFVIRTTHETRGVDRNKNVVQVKAGTEIVVPANYELAVNLARFALDADNMHELGIVARDRTDIGGGKKMWRFRVITTGKTEKRSAAYALPAEQVMGQLGEGAPKYDAQTGEALPVNQSATA